MLRSKRLHEELNEDNARRNGSFRPHAERRLGIDKAGRMWSDRGWACLRRTSEGVPDPVTDT